MEILRRYRLAPPADKGKAGKILFAKTTYALFYLFLTIMVATGLIMIFEDVPLASAPCTTWPKEIAQRDHVPDYRLHRAARSRRGVGRNARKTTG